MIDDELAELTKEQLIIVVKAQDNTIKELDTKLMRMIVEGWNES